jgi:hypothetical protein
MGDGGGGDGAGGEGGGDCNTVVVGGEGGGSCAEGVQIAQLSLQSSRYGGVWHLRIISIGGVSSCLQNAGFWSAHAAGCELGASEGEDGEGDGGCGEAGGGCIGGVDAALAIETSWVS